VGLIYIGKEIVDAYEPDSVIYVSPDLKNTTRFVYNKAEKDDYLNYEIEVWSNENLIGCYVYDEGIFYYSQHVGGGFEQDSKMDINMIMN
jgi:hypothetical protein